MYIIYFLYFISLYEIRINRMHIVDNLLSEMIDTIY